MPCQENESWLSSQSIQNIGWSPKGASPAGQIPSGIFFLAGATHVHARRSSGRCLLPAGALGVVPSMSGLGRRVATTVCWCPICRCPCHHRSHARGRQTERDNHLILSNPSGESFVSPEGSDSVSDIVPPSIYVHRLWTAKGSQYL